MYGYSSITGGDIADFDAGHSNEAVLDISYTAGGGGGRIMGSLTGFGGLAGHGGIAGRSGGLAG